MALEKIYEKLIEIRNSQKNVGFREIKNHTTTVVVNSTISNNDIRISICNNHNDTLMVISYEDKGDELLMTAYIDRSIKDYDLSLSEIEVSYISSERYAQWLYPDKETVYDGDQTYDIICDEKQLEVHNRLNSESVRKPADGFPMLYSRGHVENWSRGEFDGRTFDEAIAQLNERIKYLESKRPKK